jgi:mono/diheme cytochrome c family protein/glucose/arabinose dehydrogenase
MLFYINLGIDQFIMVPKYFFSSCFLLLVFAFSSCSTSSSEHQWANERRKVVYSTDFTPLSPEESISRIQLPPGYRVELVAAEPMVQEPVALCWDGDGRMYVAEMNTYMIDGNGTGEFEPVSRIKLLEDLDGDGKMDKSTIFIDSLVIPRSMLVVGDELLVGVTNNQNIYSYKDTNGDGKADQKRLVFKNDVLDVRNLEHQNGGWVWNIDNWIYPTRDNLRYRYVEGRLIADTMMDNMIGQWGMTTDDYGRLFYSEAGPGLPAVQIQQMPAYGALNFADQYSEDFTKPWPVVSTIDAQSGPAVLRSEDSTLKEFTSGCGQSIFRGDRMPNDMIGDYFIAEPVGRIIKRGKVINKDGKIVIEDAYKEKDWLASTDLNFRPLNTYTGPDGSFYIVDMYHGIIQESEWTKPGTYLGKLIAQKELYKNRGMGRIYRVVHESKQPDKNKPQLLKASVAELVQTLGHPNGWWRDQAQQLLIVRNEQSAVPLLKAIVKGESSAALESSEKAVVHALWTLEGLGQIDKSILKEAFQHHHPQVRKAAVWISEQYFKQQDEEIIGLLSALKNDESPDVKFQLTLSLRYAKNKEAIQLHQALINENKQNEMIQFSHTVYKESKRTRELEEQRTKSLSPMERDLVNKGAKIYKQFCIDCHGEGGKGIQVVGKNMPAPPLAGSPRLRGDKTMNIQIMLWGLKGPVDGKVYPNVMPSMRSNNDEWISAVLSYIRNSSEIGNQSSIVTPEEVGKVREGMPKEIPNDLMDGMTMQILEIMKLGRAENKNWDRKRGKVFVKQ